MPNLTGMTLAELRAAPVGQIQAAAKARIEGLSKRQLIRLEIYLREWEPTRTVTLPDDAVRQYGPDQQITRDTYVRRDELGAVVERRVVTYTYYSPEPGRTQGVLDTVVITRLGTSGNVLARRTIKHYEDGRPPVVVDSGGMG